MFTFCKRFKIQIIVIVLCFLQDKMLDSFLETGSWFETSGVEKVDAFLLPRRIYPFLNTVAWALITLPIVTYYLFKLFMSASAVPICIACALIATCKYQDTHLVSYFREFLFTNKLVAKCEVRLEDYVVTQLHSVSFLCE